MSLPRFSQDPRAAQFVQDPYPTYRHLRGHPFVMWEDLDLVVTARADLTQAILRDRRFGREPAGGHPPARPEIETFARLDRAAMLDREPPDHTRLRALVLRAFTSTRVARLAPWIEARAAQLLDQAPDGPFDLIATLAEPLPVQVIAHMMGVPLARAPDLLNWSHAMVAMYQPGREPEVERRAVAAAEAFGDYIGGLIAARARAPGDDLLSALVRAHQGEERLSHLEVVANAILLLNAGHEATVHGIANGVKALLESGQYGAAPNDAMVEEVLRFDPPLHLFTRHVREACDVAGHHFAQGQQVGVLLAGAARDPKLCPQPDDFRPARAPCPHVSFGAGLHFCVGAPLARLEILIALRTLTARFPQLRLAAPPIYANRWHFRGLNALMVRA